MARATIRCLLTVRPVTERDRILPLSEMNLAGNVVSL